MEEDIVPRPQRHDIEPSPKEVREDIIPTPAEAQARSAAAEAAAVQRATLAQSGEIAGLFGVQPATEPAMGAMMSVATSEEPAMGAMMPSISDAMSCPSPFASADAVGEPAVQERLVCGALFRERQIAFALQRLDRLHHRGLRLPAAELDLGADGSAL